MSGNEHRGTPLFTIVMATLNAERHIAEALDSVAAQTMTDYELIVVDGASSDSTMDIVRDREPLFQTRLRAVSQPDSGIYAAMNSGVGLANGAYIQFLGADDRLTRNALAIVAAAVEHSGPQVVCGATRVFDDRHEWIEAPRQFAGRVPKRAPARHQSIFVDTDLVRAIGGFDTSYRIAADYDLFLRLVERGASVELVDAVLSEFRLGGVSSSSLTATADEYRRIRIAHGSNRMVESLVFAKSLAAAKIASVLRSNGISRGRI